MARRLLFFQYGDYVGAWRRSAEGGPETYRDQRHSVDYVARLAGRFEVTTLCIGAPVGRETLADGLHGGGIDRADAEDYARLAPLLDAEAPDLMVCRTPNRQAMRWAAANGVPTLLDFADFFQNGDLRAVWRNLRLRRVLASTVFPCVANHNLAASRSVVRALGYPASRVVPRERLPLAVAPLRETRRRDPARLSVFYAGALSASKGVGDLLEAVSRLAREGRDVRLALAGGGDAEAWRATAAAGGIADRVEFLGLVGHGEVRARMAAADAVAVPSRHDYPEGMPNTLYEALAARTPLVASDHPAFAERLAAGGGALLFRAADPGALAARLASLMDDAALYARLCAATEAAHAALYFGTEWSEIVARFLDDPGDRTGWVAARSLAAIEARAAAAA
ncbi:MAG: glycosyltransferase family 4 protein [Paracoccaceae bacterium]